MMRQPKIMKDDGKIIIRPDDEIDTSLLDRYLEGQHSLMSVGLTVTQEDHVLEDAEEVFDCVRDEIKRQFEKWGEQHHDPHVWNTVTLEEYGEVAKALLEAHFYRKEWRGNLEEGTITGALQRQKNKQQWEHAMEECIHMIACAIQWYHALKEQSEWKPEWHNSLYPSAEGSEGDRQ